MRNHVLSLLASAVAKALCVLTVAASGELTLACPASAWTHGTAASGNCLLNGGLDGDGNSDGCAGAPPGGTLYYASRTAFATAAKQSGQGTWYSAPSTPTVLGAPWNLPGIDPGYYLGPDLVHVATLGGTLPGGFHDPTTESAALAAQNCAYSSGGTTPNAYQQVICTGAGTLDGWDFTAHGGVAAINLEMGSTGSTPPTITIENSKIGTGTFIEANTGVYNGAYNINIPNTYCAALTLTQDSFNDLSAGPDGGSNYTVMAGGVLVPPPNSNGCVSTLTETYDYVFATPQHHIHTYTAGQVTSKYNLGVRFGGCQGSYVSGNCFHASWLFYEQDSATSGNATITDNVLLADKYSVSGTALISAFAESTYVTAQLITSDNLLVTNVTQYEGAPTSASMGEAIVIETNPSGVNFTNWTANHNYFGPEGTFGCLTINSTPGNIGGIVNTGNIDLYDGSTTTYAATCNGVY